LKKVRKLSFLGILSVLTVVLFLAGISFMQAQVKIQKKPSPEPEATWAARIPTLDSGYMFYGMDANAGYYEDNDPNIVVSVKKNTMAGPWGKYYNFVYSFDFTLTNENVGTGVPPANQVGFQKVGGLYAVDYPDEDKPNCQFPYVTSGPPDCMADFLNNVHPYSGGESGEEDYQYLLCRVSVFDQDIELMEIGNTYLFGSASDPDEPGDFFRIKARYRQECYPEPAYHDVELYRSINIHRAIDLGNPINIEIVRLDATDYKTEFGIGCEAVWRICVLPVDYRFIDGFLKVQEQYCIRAKWYHPMEAKGNFDFYIDFIKNPQSSTPPEEPPDPPSNLSAAPPACDQIDLYWTDNSNNEDGFEIERNGSFLNTVNANETSYNDTTVSENTSYSYRVMAFNSAGGSAYSDPASATTPFCSTEPPVAPSGLTANARGKAKIALNWTDNSNNEDGFKIYRDSDPEPIAYIGPNTTSYVDSGLASKTTYYYEVCAYNSFGESCSNTVSAKTK